MLVRDLGLERRVTVLPTLDDRLLAAVYRRASVVVLPSDREGFGLPVLESLRSGTAVVAADLPVLREVGGPLTHYCPAGDIEAWTCAVTALLAQPPMRRLARRACTGPSRSPGADMPTRCFVSTAWLLSKRPERC